MAKYRSKPTEIEANQFRGFYSTPYPPGVEFEDNSNDPEKEQKYGRYAFFVTTVHKQRCYIEDGDWVIREPDGVHYYPCKNDIFVKRYDPV